MSDGRVMGSGITVSGGFIVGGSFEFGTFSFKKPGVRDIITVPHPKKNFGPGLVLTIYKQAGWSRD